MTDTAARRAAVSECGRCHQPETAHWYSAGTAAEDQAVIAALGGACTQFAVSDAALAYQQYLGIAGGAPVRIPGRPRAKRTPLCRRCGYRHRGECLI